MARRSGFAAVDRLLAEHHEVARRLARARVHAPSHPDTETLEARHAALHLALRHDPQTPRQWLDRFFERTLPQATRELRPFLGATLLGFVLAALAGYGLVSVEPDSIRLFASSEMMQQVREGRLWTEGLLGVAPASVLSGMVFANNLVVALTAWLLGFLFAIGTVYAIGVNGVMLGALFAFSAANGLGGAFLGFAVAHGPAEIFCLCAAGAAGAVVGEALARPGEATRAEAFSAAVCRTAVLLPVIGGLLVMCALIEGNVSTRDWPFTANAAVGFGALVVAVSALVDWRDLFAASRPRPPTPDAPATR
ncbi:MAG: stage II sporulation protein M [Gammaproteobacteria bacterium]